MPSSTTGQGRGLLALPILQREDGRSDAIRLARYGKTRHWAVYASDGALICVCVYKRGALEVLRRLQSMQHETG